MRPRIGVVSYLAHHRYEPRGVRTRAVVEALASDCDVDLVAGPPDQATTSSSALRHGVRFAKYRATRAAALDRAEWWGRRALRGWGPGLDGALLVGFPFSPVVQAARQLTRNGVPFVVDASDPWTLTATDARRNMGAIAFSRARAAEQRLWEGATGAILTTTWQERALSDRFAHLRTMVRPNGFREDAPRPRPRNIPRTGVLRIGHFGNLYAPRVDVSEFFDRLCRASYWDTIVLEQYGADWNHTLRRLPADLNIRVHEPLPWVSAVERSSELDVALAIGNIGGAQLPSKVVDYLTLPIPRVAVVARPDRDAISDYVMDKPGWLVIGVDDDAPGARLAAHLAIPWTADRLAPPAEESWPAVGRQIASFVYGCLGFEKQPDPAMYRSSTNVA
jgi:hypothetical protein